MTRELRVVTDGALAPARNMARDEALLDADGAWLRLYSWDPATLSLGYFQRLADFADFAPELPRVRRPTGGGAILHADEITFALAVPEALVPGDVRASYDLVNAAVVAAAAAEGYGLTAPGAVAPGAPPAWCFAAATGLDLVHAGRKVFGSAQRRRGARVLQHGSLVLRAHPLTPFTGELAGVDPARLQQALISALAHGLGCHIRPAALPEEVLERERLLVRERYASPLWTARR